MVSGFIKVSFESSSDGNNAARRALTGTQTAGDQETPFSKSGTSAYSCRDADEVEVAAALEKFAKVVAENVDQLDHLVLAVDRTV